MPRHVRFACNLCGHAHIADSSLSIFRSPVKDSRVKSRWREILAISAAGVAGFQLRRK